MAEKKMINVRLNPELWKRAKAAAGEQGVTLERWVTDALEAHLADQSGGRGGQDDDLAWRVSALEQAVDYLASALGAGFPERGGAPNSGAAATSGLAGPAPTPGAPAAAGGGTGGAALSGGR